MGEVKVSNEGKWQGRKFSGKRQDLKPNNTGVSTKVDVSSESEEKTIDIPEKPVLTKKAYYGVLTGIVYSDHDVRRNQLPECIFEAPEGMSEKEIADKAFVERLERNCADCKGCSSYNYYL